MPSIFSRIPRFPEVSGIRCGFPFSGLFFLFVNLFFNGFAMKRSGICDRLFTHCHKKSKLIDLKGQLFERGFAQTKVFIISIRISNLSVKLLSSHFLVPPKFHPLSSHFTLFSRCSLHCFCLLAPARSIESVHEDIGMLQTPVFSCVRGDLVWVGLR
jgi:hypothetical protein